MKAGTQVKELYDTAVQTVSSKKPELADNFVKNIGFGVSLAIWFDCSRVLRKAKGGALNRPVSISVTARI